ncbi:MAG: 2-amino-4-hydroxy-6-hydroxymethyldihydropteridine diphosphokinase [Chromatiaceae bacterium]|jgi:2-amino-4-hydroxy-6-hydroxymethyldihydropteridine diphosphokinase|nr:2-amino-4-hydroxy-6-hydroxymethyldihydropteridine diphosphokinase [Chromatiaceae bacterium]
MSRPLVTAYLGIGGNLGNVRATFSGAMSALKKSNGISITGVSPLYATPPVGGPEAQPLYLNAVIEIDTRLDAWELLTRLLDIETEFARVRTIRWGPRTLDLDLLLFGPAEYIDDPPDLIVPHPRLVDRTFVLEPLADLAPSLIVPGTGRSVEALRDALPASDRAGIRLVGTTWT